MKKKTKKQLWKKAWEVFRAFIIKRDSDWRGYVICFTCDKLLNLEENKGYVHAGHFRHGKQKENYFNEDNVHAQCQQCNYYGGEKTMSQYTINLVKLIGIEKVEALQNSKDKYWSNKDLEAVIDKYS